MKKIILLVLTVFTFQVGVAQINSGTVRVGGSSNFDFTFTKSSSDSGEASGTVFLINGSAGYFAAENFSIGLILQGLGVGGDFNSSSTFFFIGPQVRYYVNGKFILGAFKVFDTQSSFDVTPLTFEIGYAAFVSDKVAIEPVLNVSSESETFFGNKVTTTNIGLQVGISVYF